MLVQGCHLLACGESVFDFSPGPGYLHQLGQSDRTRCVSPVEGVLAVGDPAADQQPVRPGARGDGRVGHVDQGPVIPTRAGLRLLQDLRPSPFDQPCQLRLPTVTATQDNEGPENFGAITKYHHKAGNLMMHHTSRLHAQKLVILWLLIAIEARQMGVL